MLNSDRYCTQCEFYGSHLDFAGMAGSTSEPENQYCHRTLDCGRTVEWKGDND